MTKILILQEYGVFTNLKTAADIVGLTKGELWSLILGSLKKLSIVYPRQSFIETKGLDQFRFAGIAGVIALNAKVHIEIIPKFLDGSTTSWKDDFLFLSVLTSNGFLFEKRLHTATSSSTNDLYEIISRIWIEKFEKNQRKIIKTYIKTTWSDFLLDGDTDEENILMPNPEGFLQSGLKLSRSNNSNDLLYRSCMVLLNKIKKPGLYKRLSRAKAILEKALNESFSVRHKQINISRNSTWSDLLQLSELLIKNKSLSYFNKGNAIMPGFIVRTNELWERLLFKTAKKAFPGISITKNGYQIAERTHYNGSSKKVITTPDISIGFNEGNFIVDAKYKVVSDYPSAKSGAVIASGDLYESLAFLTASGTNRLLLMYPNARKVTNDYMEGQPVETITSGNKRVIAATIGVPGIATTHGYKRFTENFYSLIEYIKQDQQIPATITSVV